MNDTKIFFSRIVILGVVGLLAGAERRTLLCAPVQVGGVSEVLIDFEHLPDGSATGSGPIGDDYAEWGVRFQTVGVDTSKSPEYSRFLHDSTYANCGACSYPPGFNIVADFDVPVYGVSAYVTSAAGGIVTMIAKNDLGELVDSVASSPISEGYTFVGPLEITSDTPIASVEWWPSRSHFGVGLDDVRIVVEDTSLPGGGQTDGPGHLVAYWDFNEGQGNIAHDVSGHDNHGTLSGPVSWAAGHEGPGLSFTGVDNYLRVENSPELNPTEALTLAGWINPTWSFHNRILQKEDSDNQYRLLKEGGDNMVFDLAGVTNGRLEHHPLPPAGEWTHVAATYDGSAMKLYYDARLVASHAASGPIKTSTKPLTIGSKHPGAPAGDEYRGLMDELRIYDCALNAGEVQALTEWTPARGIQITNVKIVRGEFVGGEFQEIEEVDRVRVGDLFQIVVNVSNLGSTTETVSNLYAYETSGQGRMELAGQPCVGLYLIDLDPGESAALYPFCPQSQAFAARASGHVDMDIIVSQDCRDTFGFDIASPSDSGLEVTNVKIMRGEFVGDAFQELEEVDELIVGDLFQVSVGVTNAGDTTKTVGSLYHYVLSGPGAAAVVGQLCVGVYLIDLEPGESAWLDAFCPATQAFEATTAGWVTMDITFGDDSHDALMFEILPGGQAGLTVTDVRLIQLEDAGERMFREIGEVQDVSVGDLFTIRITVTNQGDSAEGVSNLYGWSLSGQGDAAVVGDQPCVCLAWGELQPGESTFMMPFCGCNAFEATDAGWVTMNISFGEDSHDTLMFEILPGERAGLAITDVKLIQLERTGGGALQEIGEVQDVSVGDFFTIRVEVTNRGSSPENLSNLYAWSLSGQGEAVALDDQLCLCYTHIELQPGESAVLIPFCCDAFEATKAGWMTMDIVVSDECQGAFAFEILPEQEGGLTITDVTLIELELVDGLYEDSGVVSEVTVGDFFRVEVEVTNLGDTTRSIANRFGWSFSGAGSVDQVGAPLCIGLYLIDLEPGESAVVQALCQGMQAFEAAGAGWVMMDISVEFDCHDTFTFQIRSP